MFVRALVAVAWNQAARAARRGGSDGLGLYGPAEASALCGGCQINEVFAFLWQTGTFLEGQRGAAARGSERC